MDTDQFALEGGGGGGFWLLPEAFSAPQEVKIVVKYRKAHTGNVLIHLFYSWMRMFANIILAPQHSLKGKMVRPEGFEPSTVGLEVRCSIQLSYERTHW